MTKGIFDNSQRYHITNAKNHGVSAEEMVEIITHLAFYSGWPNAWAAFAHLSLSILVEGASNEWLEPVTDEEYAKLKN